MDSASIHAAVCGALQQACHASTTEQRSALQYLEQLESQDNYVATLIRVIDVNGVGAEASTDIRLLAAVLLKNAIKKRWPEAFPSANTVPICAQEREAVRAFLQGYLDERDGRVAVQLDAATARVAAQEGLALWPALLEALLAAVQGVGQVQMHMDGPGGAAGTGAGAEAGEEWRWLVALRAAARLAEVLALGGKRTGANVGVGAILCASLFGRLQPLWLWSLSLLESPLRPPAPGHMGGVGVTGGVGIGSVRCAVLAVLLARSLRLLLDCGMAEVSPHTMDSFWHSLAEAVRGLSLQVRTAGWAIQCAPGLGLGIDDGADGIDVQLLLAVPMRSAVVRAYVCYEEVLCNVALHQLPRTLKPLFLLAQVHSRLLLSLLQLSQVVQRAQPLLCARALPVLLPPLFALLCGELLPEAVALQELPPASAAVCLACGDDGSHCVGEVGPQAQAQEQAQFWGPTESRPLPLTHAVQASVLLLSNVLSCSAYDTPQGQRQGQGLEVERELAAQMRCDFFTPAKACLLLRCLLHPALGYSPSELEEWAEDAEGFYLSQQAAGEESTLRSACEGLFCGLLDAQPAAVCGILAPLLQDVHRQSAALSEQVGGRGSGGDRELQLWDAVYLCAGLAVGSLPQYLDAAPAYPGAVGSAEGGEWVRGYLGPMLQRVLSAPGCGALCAEGAGNEGNGGAGVVGQQLLRGRLLWLLAVWLHLFRAEDLPAVLGLLLQALSPQGGSDAISQMHAATALQALLNLPSFDVYSLAHSAAPVAEALCGAAVLLQTPACRQPVLELVGELVLLLSVQPAVLRPLVPPLAQYLAALCGAGQGQERVAPASDPQFPTVLDVLRGLVVAAGASSQDILHISGALVAAALGGDGGGGALLEGTALWAAMLRNLTPPSFAQNAPALGELLALGAGALGEVFSGAEAESGRVSKQACVAMEAHVLLGAACPHSAVVAMGLLLGRVEARLVSFVLRPLRAMLLCAPHAAGLLESGLLQHQLRILIASCTAADVGAGGDAGAGVGAGGPGTPCLLHVVELLESDREADVAVTSYLSLVAEALLLQPSAVAGALTCLRLQLLSALRAQSTGAGVGAGISAGIGAVADELTEGDLLFALARQMLRLFDVLAYCLAPLWTQRLWALALLQLLPSSSASSVGAGPGSGSGFDTGAWAATLLGEARLRLLLRPVAQTCAPLLLLERGGWGRTLRRQAAQLVRPLGEDGEDFYEPEDDEGMGVEDDEGEAEGEWGPAPEPLLTVHALRLEKSGLLSGSVGAELADRLGAMRACVGEAHFQHLCVVAHIDL
ncbi:armadillo-type protein [Ochromonadaceae sp. CCMP2298]|nr:armadillo-type protein [Ochromonadaceae sp. CCMP2298]